MKLERRTFLKMTGAFGVWACTMAGQNTGRADDTKAPKSAPASPSDPLAVIRDWHVKPETEPAFVFRAIR